jgi:CDP-4-dehydro-6-deoxyglucose reductase, E3
MSIVTLSSGKSYEAHSTESVLDAALRAGITLPYSCRTGRCGSCKGTIRRGTTSLLHDELELSEVERAAGCILTCVRAATSDVELAIEDLASADLTSPRTWPCRVQSIEKPAADVVRVLLRLPPTSEFGFQPGQYVDVIGSGGLRRSYSVAGASAAGKQIELHIRQVPGGVMSDYWFDRAKVNDLLRLHGPLGTFFVREIAELDLVFLATGTGIAPIKAMLEGLAQRQERPRSVRVYWGGRVPSDIYWDAAQAGIEHRFVAVLSRADAAWHGTRGHVQDALLREGCDWNRTAVYACGSEAMIHGARAQLLDAGLPERRFHSDAFVSSAPV